MRTEYKAPSSAHIEPVQGGINTGGQAASGTGSVLWSGSGLASPFSQTICA